MTDTKDALTRAQLRKALEHEFGAPADVFEFRHESEDAKVPTEIDVLCFEPQPGEQLEEEWFTHLVTCGLAAHHLSGPIPYFELLVTVRRRVSTDERRRLAKGLAELGTKPFREAFELPPELVLAQVSLPVFERMDHALLSPFLGQEHLPTNPPVALVEVTPLFPREADQLRRLGASEGLYRFGLAGVRADDPARREVDLESVTAPPEGEG